MNTNLSLQQFIKLLSEFLHRYHLMIFTVIILGGASVATFMLYQIAVGQPQASTTSRQINFDKNTIDRISKLRGEEDQYQPLILPEGRNNPFQE